MGVFLTLWRGLVTACSAVPNPVLVLEARQRSGQWRRLRNDYLKKHPHCAACGRSQNVVVHHVVPVSFDPERELDPENLITLCETPCHLVFGHFFSYSCYNRDVRRTAAEFYRALAFHRKCRPPQVK